MMEGSPIPPVPLCLLELLKAPLLLDQRDGAYWYAMQKILNKKLLKKIILVAAS